MSKDYKSVEEIISDLPAIREACISLRETLLANLVMLGEIPAPTFKELESDEFSLISPSHFSPFQRKLGGVFFCRLFFARLQLERYLQLNHFPYHLRRQDGFLRFVPNQDVLV